MKKIGTIFSVACMTSLVFGQGSLTPSSAPAPTMKTLGELDEALIGISNAVEQVEARIDVLTLASAGGAAHAIQQSGSYYLSGRVGLNGDYTNGILIDADDVTLDLNGFQINRWAGSGGSGIFISSDSASATVKNGTIGDYYGQEGPFNYGIYSEGSNTAVEAITISECSSNGFHLAIASQIINCRARSNAGSGIYAGGGSLLSGCQVNGNTGYGIRVGDDCMLSQCVMNSNVGGGIYAGDGNILNGCVAYINKAVGIFTGENNILTECSVSESTGIGFRTGSSCIFRSCVSANSSGGGFSTGANCRLSSCIARSNEGRGIQTDRYANLSDCNARYNKGSYGIDVGIGSRLSNCNASDNQSTYYGGSGGILANEASILMGCTASMNTNTVGSGSTFGVGIQIGSASIIKNCTVNENQGHGISGYRRNLVVENQCERNGSFTSGAGIYMSNGDNRIDSNNVRGNAYGIKVNGAGNLIIRNSSSSSSEFIFFTSDNYSITGEQTIGTLYESGSIVIYPLNPWANFSF